VQGNLYAVNATDGNILWEYYPGGDSSPVVINDTVYIDVDNMQYLVIALDAISGTELWKYPGSNYLVSSPAVANGVVYVSCSGNIVRSSKVYALSASTGKMIWTFTTDSTNLDYSDPVVVNGIVYVGSDDKLYALNANTGKKIWSSTLNGDVWSPVVEYGVVYVCTNKSLYALNAANGEEIWSYPIGENYMADLAIVDGVVYVGCDIDSDMTICALSAVNGEKLWNYHIGFSGKGRKSAITATNDVIYIGICTDVYAFSTIKPL
jgi:outer membrane protein assembly factor BamB